MRNYPVDKSQDYFIKDEDRNDPLDITFAEVIQNFEDLIDELKEIDGIQQIAKRHNMKDAEELMIWYTQLLGLRELHKRYHECLQMIEVLVRHSNNANT